jgi:glutathione synthase/RimK-type ligase-like ATP-grasp enzyme
MKTVIVFFDAPGFDDYPFMVEEYRTAYHEIGKRFADRSAAFWIVRSQDTYQGDNVFSGGWRFDGSAFIRVNTPVRADVIYDKGHFKADASARLLNSIELDEICTDKWKTYELFSEHCPKTFLVRSAGELENALAQIPSSLVVAKPQGGEEGKGVLIDTAENIRLDVRSFPYLIQEFMDTSGGIPGIVEGPHDFRIIVINGEIGVSYIRTPPPGELRANVAQGGKEISVPRNKIPPEAVEIVKAVDAKLARFKPRVYSADMGRMKDGAWKIIELNSKPATSCSRLCTDYPEYQSMLVDALLSAA